ncbi:hypothetical protein ABT025_10315 [Streptomyces sp. NPDC002809]|uniref:hypothetical protein n=1 Tax=Streptomyces sp. NPDC002809 TaxID=3154433 RepID=UPI00332818B3
MTAQDEPRPGECHECQEIDLAEAVARSERDGSRETDCRVLRARHRATEHEAQP